MKNRVKEHIIKHIRFYKAALMAFLPLLVCAITCAVQGYAIWDAYIPASDWNDELFYYKQVEGQLCNELAFVLHLPRTDVKEMILASIQ